MSMEIRINVVVNTTAKAGIAGLFKR